MDPPPGHNIKNQWFQEKFFIKNLLLKKLSKDTFFFTFQFIKRKSISSLVSKNIIIKRIALLQLKYKRYVEVPKGNVLKIKGLSKECVSLEL